MPTISESATAAIEYLADCSEQQLDEVLSLLESWSARSEEHVTVVRQHPRKAFRTIVRLEHVGGRPECFAAIGDMRRLVFLVPARNLSQTGVGLVAPPTFSPRLLSDMTPILRADTVLAQGATIRVQIPTSAALPIALTGSIVRLRHTHHGFVEAGVRFTGRS